MARYRKIDTRMWGDSKFRELSSPGPSAKYLWVYLLTGPHTTNLPGLFRSGEMSLAEELGWSVEGFRKGFAELFAKGLIKADWNARVVWIPNAIKYNPPDNPNVIKSWRDSWDEVPECPLKNEAYEALKGFTEGLGEGFGKAFKEGCAKGLANQEQEQEQEQTTTAVSPQPQSSDNGSPQATRKKARRTKASILSAYQQNVSDVVNKILPSWPTRQPNGDPIHADVAAFASRVDQILRDNQEANPVLLSHAAEKYLAEPRKLYRAPQYFFGPGNGTEAPWVAYARMVVHQASKSQTAEAI
jgi:hypothetical protein